MFASFGDNFTTNRCFGWTQPLCQADAQVHRHTALIPGERSVARAWVCRESLFSGARRRRGFIPELPHSTMSRPNFGRLFWFFSPDLRPAQVEETPNCDRAVAYFRGLCIHTLSKFWCSLPDRYPAPSCWRYYLQGVHSRINRLWSEIRIFDQHPGEQRQCLHVSFLLHVHVHKCLCLYMYIWYINTYNAPLGLAAYIFTCTYIRVFMTYIS